MRLGRVVAWLAVVAALGGGERAAGQAAPPGRPLSGGEIGAMLLGNTAYGKAPSGEHWSMWIAPDGKLTVRGTTMSGSIFGDVGSATIEGDRWCVAWALLTEGRKRCLTVVKDGDQFRNYAPDGHLESTYTLRPGNPEGF